MLKKEMDIAIISEVTDLSEKEINKLKNCKQKKPMMDVVYLYDPQNYTTRLTVFPYMT